MIQADTSYRHFNRTYLTKLRDELDELSGNLAAEAEEASGYCGEISALLDANAEEGDPLSTESCWTVENANDLLSKHRRHDPPL